MFRQFLILVALTILAVVFQHPLHFVMNMVVHMYHQTSHLLSGIFSGGYMGRVVLSVLVLVVVPAVSALIVSLAYFSVKRKSFPGAMMVVWVVWLVLITVFAIQGGV